MRPCEEEKQIIRGTYSNLSSILYAPFHYITKGFIKTSSKCLTSHALGTFFYNHTGSIEAPYQSTLLMFIYSIGITYKCTRKKTCVEFFPNAFIGNTDRINRKFLL